MGGPRVRVKRIDGSAWRALAAAARVFSRRGAIAGAIAGAITAAIAAAPAVAQYKVIDPQGGITYTDRPQASPGSRVVPLGRSGEELAANAAAYDPQPPLPLALRPLVARFPVTLYSAADCLPCESGRQQLQQRGVPFSERTVSGNDDIDALQRLTGGRTVPTLAVGGQVLRGYQASDWSDTLDLAGYPRQSALPRNYVAPPAAPLTASRPGATATQPDGLSRPEPQPPGAAETPPPATGIRF